MHPFVVKHLLLPVHEFVFRRGTFSYLRHLEQSQWWPRQRLRALQQAKLRNLLTHAAAKCPFYRDRIRQAGIDPNTIILEELPALPTLSKEDVRNHAVEMIDVSIPGGLQPYSTGGSTGQPLLFQISRTRQAADQAARSRTRRWFGIDLGQRELYLWGAPVELSKQDRLKKIRDNLTNQRLLNAFQMTPQAMSAYLDEIHTFNPVHLFGYPSSIACLVQHGRASGRAIKNAALKAIFTTGELLVPQDRAMIEEAFGVPVADGYGSREAGFIAHQCPHGSYHVTMESVIVELIDESGRPIASRDHPTGVWDERSAGGIAQRDSLVSEEAEKGFSAQHAKELSARHASEVSPIGEITVTHLDTYGMPFIRYRTGDLARWTGSSCNALPFGSRLNACPCGRGLEPLEIVNGRKTDMLRTANGGFAHALSVIYILREEPGIRRFKVFQQDDLSLDVQVVADKRFDTVRQRKVARLLQRQIGEAVCVRLHLVREIEPDSSGKHRYVVSNTHTAVQRAPLRVAAKRGCG